MLCSYHHRIRRLSVTAGLLVAVGMAGCENLTDVEATDVVTPEGLGTASGATALYAGAIGTFTSAYAAYPLAFIITSGLISDEFATAPPQGSWANYDFRTLGEPGATWPYNQLQLARVSALQAIDALEAYAPEPRARIGEMLAYVAYVETFFGEGMCSGIPLSQLVDNAPVFGNPLTTAEIFERAVADFEAAAENAGSSAEVLNLASVGRARALLNLGRFSEAGAAVGDVPTDFRFSVASNATDDLDFNGYYWSAYLSPFVTVVDQEGGNGLDFVSANDPRVPLDLAATPAAGLPWYRFRTYNTPNSPVDLASGIEARLIQAEAAYQANPDDMAPAGDGWLGILNELRASAIDPALPPLQDPGSREARVDMLFRERAFWTYGTGKRQGDMRRLVRQYGRAVDSVFPVGLTIHGVPYGSDVDMAPPATQYNNPNYQGCLRRGD